jgi:hypothetical protein
MMPLRTTLALAFTIAGFVSAAGAWVFMRPRTVFVATSADGAFEVKVTRRILLPPTEIDPAATCTFAVRATRIPLMSTWTGHEHVFAGAYKAYQVFEASDCSVARISWDADEKAVLVDTVKGLRVPLSYAEDAIRPENH